MIGCHIRHIRVNEHLLNSAWKYLSRLITSHISRLKNASVANFLLRNFKAVQFFFTCSKLSLF